MFDFEELGDTDGDEGGSDAVTAPGSNAVEASGEVEAVPASSTQTQETQPGETEQQQSSDGADQATRPHFPSGSLEADAKASTAIPSRDVDGEVPAPEEAASRPKQLASSSPSASPEAASLVGNVAVGDYLVSIARVLMRTGEDIRSQQVGLLPARRHLEVLEVGSDRRIHVLEENGVEGWVSVAKATGEQLLDHVKLNARQKFNFKRIKEERSGAVTAPTSGSTPSAPKKKAGVKCDKCDGPHPTDECPFFKKAREDHKDAWANYGQDTAKKMGSDGGDFTLRGARVVRQPGDGSCLFHSLSFGLSQGQPNPRDAEQLRRELAAYIERNPQQEIAGDTIEEWVRWDANSSVSVYAAQMGQRGWGGGVEMAVCSLLKAVNVHVYEASTGGTYKRISCFDTPGSKRTVHVLYQGRCHYDALVPVA